MDEIRSMKSFHYLHFPYDEGDEIDITKDIRTDLGYVLLIHSDKTELDKDYDRIVSLQQTMIEVKPQ